MPSAIFKRNLESINVELSDNQIEQLDKYYEILVEWNSFMNLTGITDYEEVMLKHYLDSLVLRLPIDGSNLNIKLIEDYFILCGVYNKTYTVAVNDFAPCCVGFFGISR